MKSWDQSRRGLSTAALVFVLASTSLLAGCSASLSTGDEPSSGSSATEGTPPAATAAAVAINVPDGATAVKVDTTVSVRATSGTIQAVSVTPSGGKSIAGEITAGGTQWRADDLLEPGTRYVVTAQAVGSDGQTVTTTSHFHTQNLSLDQQVYPSISPLAGQKVGIGMPVIVKFDHPIYRKAAVQQRLTVTSVPAQRGSWYWISDQEVHWRPRHYWKAHTKVSVSADLNGVGVGGGLYGQVSRTVKFRIGDAHIYKVNMSTDEMRVVDNGKLVKTIPITTGKPGFETRSGIKVIIEKDAVREMNSETIGIAKDNPEYYDLKDVQWAMRMTYSGEFIHAAPWSVGSQGYANVSHGCTGMSTENADWLYHHTLIGDVVVETGNDRPMELTNGLGDWNLSWADWLKGSAI